MKGCDLFGNSGPAKRYVQWADDKSPRLTRVRQEIQYAICTGGDWAGILKREKERTANKCCKNKKRYGTKQEALNFLTKTKANDGAAPYRCEKCKGYHAGHPPGAAVYAYSLLKINS